MLTIVLAAGNGQRFADAGYPMPKPLLSMPDHRPLIAWVRERLPHSQQAIVMRRADQQVMAPHITGMAQVWLDHVTDGPLASARAASHLIDAGDELLITYCDTLLPNGAQAFIDAARAVRADTAMVVFESTDPRYGYWDGRCVVEKQAISPWAVSGLFYFHRGRLFLDCAAHVTTLGAGLPSLMNAATYCYESDVIDVGTPTDYEAVTHV